MPVRPRSAVKKAVGLAVSAVITASCLTVLPAAPASAVTNSELGYPVFRGLDDPVPATGAAFTTGNMMKSIYDADLAKGAGTPGGPDFWMDKMLVREGTGPDSNESDANQYLFSRGRAVFMKAHDPSVLGFGGEVAYWESIDGKPAYTITLSVDGEPITLTEDGDQRKQTPSYWQSTFTSSDSALTVVETKFITNANVAVTEFTVKNSGSSAKKVAVVAKSSYTTVVDGDELTGTVQVLNNLTTIYPRFSGDDLKVADGALTGTLDVPGGGSAGTKIQLGFVAPEVDGSRAEYDSIRTDSPAEAYTAHVRAYNQWWADNVPYLDVPDQNIKKSIYYRWWLMRFNFLDANIPGNDYQFPTSVEGALGYNNAIDLTIPLFIDDLKYLRNSAYSYGPWVSAGEVAGQGKYKDNPGDPANWSTSHAQYISAAAWRSYQLHGGPASIAAKLAQYAEDDVNGELKDYDRNGNNVLDIDGTAWTGNDADAVSYDYKPGSRLDRPETAFTWAGAEAARQAYTLTGDSAGAERAQELADKIKKGMLDTLWDPSSKDILSRIAGGQYDGTRVPWKEINNYDAFAVQMMPKEGDADYSADYVEALRHFASADEFPIFPFYTANQADKKEAEAAGHPGSNNFSVINSTGMMNTFASVIRHYPTSAITADSLKKLIAWNAYAIYQNNGDNRYPDQNEFWAAGSADPQGIGYRSWIHHTILGATNHTVIEDVMGLQARADGKVEMWPIDMGLDHFAASNLAYRNADLSITWVKPGSTNPYGSDVPQGYSIWVDGKRVATTDALSHFVYDPATGQVSFPGGSGTATYTAKSSVEAPQDVTIAEGSRTADIFDKVGVDVSGQEGTNLASGATVTATETANGTSTAAVVDGSTALAPIWSDAGSSTATDSLTLTLPAAKSVNDLKVFYYSDKLAGGVREPAEQTVEYLDGDTWKAVPDASPAPVYPRANLNDLRFGSVTTSKLRLTVRPQSGYRTGIKEIQVFNSKATVPAAENAAPSVHAWIDPSVPLSGQAGLLAVVKDDGAPSAELSQKWSVASAPADSTVVFTSPTTPSTTAQFSEAGTYVLRLTATDGSKSASYDVTVVAGAAGGGANVARDATPSASYTAPWTNINSVNDGEGGNTGGSNSDVWATWSGDRPATQWLEYSWKNPVRISGSDITFWHDSPAGGNGVAVPKSWKLQYLASDGTTWTDVPDPSGFGTKDSGSNKTTFSPVTTTALRATFDATTDGSTYAGVGVSEWQVLADAPTSVSNVAVRTKVGVIPTLPSTVEVVYSDGSRGSVAVSWPEITSDQVAKDGADVTVKGIVSGSGLVAQATVYVRSQFADSIVVVDPVEVSTTVNRAPSLPSTVTVTYNDGSRDSSIPVTWATIDPSSYASEGTFTVSGTVQGTTRPATATVTVGQGGSEPGGDTTPPVITIAPTPATPSGQNDWYTGSVSVKVGATDDSGEAPTVQVSIDGGPWVTPTGSVTFEGDGPHQLEVKATDGSGNASDEEFDAQIDGTAPVSNASLTTSTRSVSLRAADATSQVAGISYSLNGSAWTAYTGAINVGNAKAVLQYRSTDMAGNQEVVNTLAVPAAGSTQQKTTTAVKLSASKVAVGGRLSATVTVKGSGSTPTGTVRVLAGNVQVGRGTLSGGKVTLKLDTSELKPGKTTLTVQYLGNASSAGSKASTTVTLTKASTKTKVTLSSTRVKKGSSTTATVTVSATGVVPQGQVVIKAGSTKLGTAQLSNGKAKIKLSTKKLSVRTHTLTVSYSGGTQTGSSTAKVKLTVRR